MKRWAWFVLSEENAVLAAACDVMHSRADINRLTTAGFQCANRFDQGLEKTITFFRKSIK